MLLADLSSATYTTSSPRLLSKYSAAADLVLRVFDLTMVVASGLIAYRIVFGTWVPAAPYRVAIATTLLYSVICFALFPLYRSWRGRGLLSELMVLGGAFGGVFALFAVHALIVQVGEQVSRGWIGLWFVGGLVSLVAARTLLRGFLNHLRTQGVDVQRVVVVGLRHPVMKISHYLSRNPWVGMNLVGYFRTPYDLAVTDQRQGLPCLGDPDELIEYLKNNQVEQVWISLPLGERDHIKQLLQRLDRYPINVKLVPDLFDFGLLNQSAEQIGSVPVINLRQGGVDRDNYFVVAKALQDKILAVIALMGLWPLMLAIAVGVKMSSPGRCSSVSAATAWVAASSTCSSSARCGCMTIMAPRFSRRPRTTRGLRASAVSCAAAAWTSCRRSSMSWVAACRSWARARTPRSTTRTMKS